MTDDEIEEAVRLAAARFERDDERKWYRQHRPRLRELGVERVRRIKADLEAKRGEDA